MTLKVGVVRATWPYATRGANGGVNFIDAENTLCGPAAYHNLIPAFGAVTGTNSVSVDGTSDTFEAEQEQAFRCGFDHWIFDYYDNAPPYPVSGGTGLIETGLNHGLQLYMASAKKSLVKFCILLVADPYSLVYPITTGNWGPVADRLVAFMGDSQYQTGPSGRPIIYLFDGNSMVSNGFTAAMITTLRNKATAAGLQNPYIGWNTFAASDSEASSLGVDFIYAYTITISGNGSTVSVATWDALHTTSWNALEALTLPMVPVASVGWDTKARYEDGFYCTWFPGYTCPVSGHSPYDYTARSTPAQIGARVKAAADFALANPSDCDGNILVNAWDEYTEGGNSMGPNRGDWGMNSQITSQQMQRQRENRSAMRGREIQLNSR